MNTADVTRPLPEASPKMRPFYQAAAEGRLVIQCCSDCGFTCFPAHDMCSACLTPTLEWIDASGIGEVFSFVVMHQIYHPWFADRTPYVVAVIKLKEGPHILSTVVETSPDEVRIGQSVQVDFQACDDHIKLPVFKVTTTA